MPNNRSPITPNSLREAAGGSEDDDLDLSEYIGTIVDARWLIAIVTIVILAAAVFKAYTATPIYQADALIQVEQKKSAMGGLEGLGAFTSRGTSTPAEIEIIKSRTLLTKVVNALKLNVIAKPMYFPLIGGFIARRHAVDAGLSTAWMGLDDYAWGGEKIQLDRLSVLGGRAMTMQLVAMQDQHYQLRDASGATLLEGTVGHAVESNGISLFVSQLVARPGTHFVISTRTSISVAQELQRGIRVSQKGGSSEILQLVYQSADPAIAAQVVDAVARTYLRQNVERRSEEAQQSLAFLEQQLPKVKERMDMAEDALNAYRLKRGLIDLTMETKSVLEQGVVLQRKISELKMQRAELKQKFTEQHPLLQGLNDKLLRLQKSKRQYNQKIKQLPKTEQETLRLTRDVKVNTELYTFLLNKVPELKIVKAGTIGNVRVLDYAVMPQVPVKPKKSKIILLGLALGLFIGILLAFVRKTLQKGIESPDVIEQKLGIPVFASVPHTQSQVDLHEQMRKHKGKDGDCLLASVKDSDLAIESLRSLRTNLHFGLMDAKNNIVMISGPSPGVGKSFVSANLAHVLSSGGKRVLLIDADMRKGHLNEYFGLQRAPGLSECICGHNPMAEAVNRTKYENLDMMTTGSLPPNPSELLMNEHFETMLAEASKSYDLVLIDTPPVLAVTDAVVIGKLAGTAFLLLRAGRHPIQEIQQAVRHLEHGGVKLQGIIFNDLKAKRSKYGYGYGYGSYQYEYTKD